jgi:hypothetical protein
MRLSREKLLHLSNVIFKALLKENLILTDAHDSVRQSIRNTIINESDIDEQIDNMVKTKLRSYKKTIFEGSSEWDAMYEKFFHEELIKRGRV